MGRQSTHYFVLLGQHSPYNVTTPQASVVGIIKAKDSLGMIFGSLKSARMFLGNALAHATAPGQSRGQLTLYRVICGDTVW